MGSTFRTVPTIVHGHNAFDELGTHVRALGDRALIVSGCSAMREQGVLDRAEDLLREAGVEAEVFEGVPPEPTLEWVDRVRARAQSFRADLLIGIGGGSALDVGKAAAGLLKEPEETMHYFTGGALAGHAAPFVAAPSTFGTGTEATPNAVLIDPAGPTKKSIRHPSMLPRVAIVDPQLGRGASARVKAEAGMDALAQAIEGFCSRFSTSVSESLSFGAVALLAAHLESFVFTPDDMESAEQVANGSLMAGMAFSNCRLGLVHGLAHPLGARYGVPHGRLCAVLLPHVLRYNRDTVPEQYALLCGIVKTDIAEFCEDLLVKLGLPRHLGDVGVQAGDLPGIISETLPSGSTKANPRPATEPDLHRILLDVCRLGEAKATE